MEMLLYQLLIPILAPFHFGLSIVAALFLVSSLRVMVQIFRSRPRPRTHPTDHMALLPETAQAHFTSQKARAARWRFLGLVLVALLFLPSLDLIEEIIDGPTRLWPRTEATVVGIRFLEAPDRERVAVEVYYTYVHDPLFSEAEELPGSFQEPYDSLTPAERSEIEARYAEGSTVPIHIDPFNARADYYQPPIFPRGLAVYVVGLVTPFLLLALSFAVVGGVWHLRRRSHTAAYSPVADSRTIQAELEPLTDIAGVQMMWRPRWRGGAAIYGIRHVLVAGDRLYGVLEYDPTTKRVRAEFKGHSCEIDLSPLSQTISVQHYAAADLLLKTARLPILYRGTHIGELQLKQRIGALFAKVRLLDGTHYTLHKWRAYRHKEREHTLMLYGRKKSPGELAKLLTADLPLNRGLLRFEEPLPPDHAALLALAGWLLTGWSTGLDLEEVRAYLNKLPTQTEQQREGLPSAAVSSAH